MAKRRRTRPSRFATQATQEAGLKYAPQQQTLADLLSSLGTQRDAAIQGSLAAAAGIGNAAAQGRQSALQDYGGAAYKELGSQNFTRDQLGKLASSPSVDVVKAGAESEAQAGRQRLSTMALGALDELRARGSRAAEAGDYAIQRALQQYGGDAGKVMAQLQALSGQEGSFAAQRESQLSEDAKKLGATLRGQTLSAATTRRGQDITSATAAAGRATTQRGQDLSHADRVAARRKKGKGKSLTPDQVSKRIAMIRTAQVEASKLIRQGGKSKSEAGQALVQGYTIPSRDPRTGLSTSRTVKPIPASLAAAGIELATQRAIGPHTARRLVVEQGLHVHGRLPVMKPVSKAQAGATRTVGRNVARETSRAARAIRQAFR